MSENSIGGSVDVDLAPLTAMTKGLKVALIISANRAAKPVRQAVIANAEAKSLYGFLGRSIGTKTRVYGTARIVTIIGPKMSFSRTKGTYSRGPNKGQRRRRTPYLYGFLVERGTSRSKPKPFLEPAMAAQGGEFSKTLAESLRTELAAIAAANPPKKA